MGYFRVRFAFENCFGFYSCSWTPFIFYESMNSEIWIWLDFGVVFVLWGPNGLVWGLGVGVRFENCFGFYSCSWSTFILYVSVNSGIWFLLNWGHFCLFGALMGYFWVGVGFENCFGFYSCSWTTFICFASFNSNIWFWLNFEVIFDVFGPYWAIFGVGVGFKNWFGVS